MPGFVNRDNRVPYYQRLYQEGQRKHIRQWNQTARGSILMRVYLVALWGTTGCTTYAMVRLLLGHKTWW